jgi:hypothetical protein
MPGKITPEYRPHKSLIDQNRVSFYTFTVPVILIVVVNIRVSLKVIPSRGNPLYLICIYIYIYKPLQHRKFLHGDIPTDQRS